MVRKIDALILAAGYGTRLEKDINEDTSGEFVHLRGLPKPLVPVGGKPLINYWIDQIRECSDIFGNTYVATNSLFHDKFEQWAKANNFPLEDLVKDPSTCNQDRLGAVANIELVIETKKIENDLLIIAGDTLFEADFRLKDYVQKFHELEPGISLITYYTLKDHNEVSKRGIIELDENHQVTNFLEKPDPKDTPSNRAVPPLYLYSCQTLEQIRYFVKEYTKTRNERDAPGQFVAYLYPVQPVFGYEISGRFDIGGLNDYRVADKYYYERNAS